MRGNDAIQSSAKHMKRFVAALSVCALCLDTTFAGTIRATCTADYGGITETLTLAPAPDVFSFESASLGDRFEFRAQYLEDRAKLKTFVYEFREAVPALIHANEQRLSPSNCQQRVEGFGLNKVYSSDLEREMFFQCFAVCD